MHVGCLGLGALSMCDACMPRACLRAAAHLHGAIELQVLHPSQFSPEYVSLWAHAHPLAYAVDAAWCAQRHTVYERISTCCTHGRNAILPKPSAQALLCSTSRAQLSLTSTASCYAGG